MKAFVIDVDGCLTDGGMWYTKDGKVMKAFGVDDHDGLRLLEGKLDIYFVTADYLGFEIAKRRIEVDMGFPLALVPMVKRPIWIRERWMLSEVIYMGDGILDGDIFEQVGYSICPSVGFYLTKKKASYVTQHNGGHRAVAEACLHIKERFLDV